MGSHAFLDVADGSATGHERQTPVEGSKSRPSGSEIEQALLSFDPFANDKRYIRLNAELLRLLLRHSNPGRPFYHVLDLACGTGLLTKLLVNASRFLGRGSQVVCLDPDRDSLQLAHKDLATAPAAFVTGRAEGLPLASGVFDLVLFGNAIHLMKDKEMAVQEIYRVLRPQGLLAFNTTYYTGCYPEESKAFYLSWTKRALALLRDSRVQRQQKGLRSTAMDWLSPEQYRDILEKTGFSTVYLGERIVGLLQKSLQAIASYRDFAQGALRVAESDLAAASRALQRAVRPALRDQGLKVLPRRWLEVIAQKG